VMDDWIVPVDVVPPSFRDILKHPGNKGVVNALVELSKAKNVRYIPGNHDMLVKNDDISPKFPLMTFGGNHDYGLQYIDGNVITEHGTSSAMFNGPDDVRVLPLGYFISRMVATHSAYAEGGSGMDFFDAAEEAIKGFVTGKVNKNDVIRLVVKAVCKATGLTLDTKILMRPDSPIDTGGKGYVTVKKVRDMYADLASGWKKTDHLLPALPAANVDVHNVELMCEPLCKLNGTGVSVMGHTHDEMNIYDGGYVYANCGCWCKKTLSLPVFDDHLKPIPGKLQTTGNGHFVTTEDKGGETTATLYYWDEKSAAPKGDGNPVVFPKPSPGPMG